MLNLDINSYFKRCTSTSNMGYAVNIDYASDNHRSNVFDGIMIVEITEELQEHLDELCSSIACPESIDIVIQNDDLNSISPLMQIIHKENNFVFLSKRLNTIKVADFLKSNLDFINADHLTSFYALNSPHA